MSSAAIVRDVTLLSPEVVRLRLDVLPEEGFPYIAGQYVALALPDGTSRCYSMAHPYRSGEPMEFHVRLLPGGAFSGWLRQLLQGGLPSQLTVGIAGPFGNCTWRSNAGPVIMLATGTGIAPLLAMLESLADDMSSQTPVTLYWGARRVEELYCREDLLSLESSCTWFQFNPVLESPTPDWGGRTGFVQDCAARDFDDLRSAAVFACGAPLMVEQARHTLTTSRGLDARQFFADSFASNATNALPSASSTGEIAVHIRMQDGARRLISVPVGMTLMQSLRGKNLLLGACGGNAACGTCRIEVLAPWVDRLQSPTSAETRLLQLLHTPQPNDRLACQIQLEESLEGISLAIPTRPL